MCAMASVRAALDLLHVPSRVRVARSEPLPCDVVVLLRIAAGDENAAAQAAEITGRAPKLFVRRPFFS